MQVQFTYRDFDGSVKEAEAEVKTDDTSMWAQNLAKFGCGKRVPLDGSIGEAITLLIGHREVLAYRSANS